MNHKRDYSDALIITGEHKQLKKFRKDITTRSTRLSLSKLMPVPEELDAIPHWHEAKDLTKKKRDRLQKKYGTWEKDKWRIRNWGVANDIYTRDNRPIWRGSANASLPIGEKYEFTSDLGAPVKWLTKVAKIYPTLKFELMYEDMEGGNSYTYEGYASFECGKSVIAYNKKRMNEPDIWDSDWFADDNDEEEGKTDLTWYDKIKSRAEFISEDEI